MIALTLVRVIEPSFRRTRGRVERLRQLAGVSSDRQRTENREREFRVRSVELQHSSRVDAELFHSRDQSGSRYS